MVNDLSERVKKVFINKQKRMLLFAVVTTVVAIIWLVLLLNDYVRLASVMSTLFVSLLVPLLIMTVDYINSRDEVTNTNRNIATFIKSHLNTKTCAFCNTGLVHIHPKRGGEIEQSLVMCATNSGKNGRIKFFTPNLGSMQGVVLDRVEACAKKGVHVEICTITSDVAKAFYRHRRTKQLSDNELDTYVTGKAGEVKTSLDMYAFRLLNNKNYSVDIRICDMVPTMILFIIDNDCYLNFMFQNAHAKESLQMKFNLANEDCFMPQNLANEDCFMPQKFVDHFDDVFYHKKTQKVSIDTNGHIKYDNALSDDDKEKYKTILKSRNTSSNT